YTYAQIRSALTNDATPGDANDTAAVASLGLSDPIGGTIARYFVTRAQAKALGLMASDTAEDGTFTFGATHAYTYAPNNRAVAGKFDLIDVAFHEITEILSRNELLGDNLSGSPNCMAFHLCRFT